MIDFLLGFGEFPDFLLDLLDPLDDRPQLIARQFPWSAHDPLLVNTRAQSSAIRAAASSRTRERGNQPVSGRSEILCRRVLDQF